MSKDHGFHESTPVVLIVQGDPDLASQYASYLSATCRVTVAETGDEALEHIDHSLDVAFLDRDLGDWSGDELVNVIHERGIDCGIVMVTSVEPSLDIVDLPVDDYLTKPVFREDLQLSVEDILYRKIGGADRREFLGLISRRIALANHFHGDELANEPEYVKLQRRIAMAEDRLDLRAVPQQSKYRPKACTECELRWDVQVDGTVGYVRIAACVWKCTRCGHVIHLPDPSDRFVAR